MRMVDLRNLLIFGLQIGVLQAQAFFKQTIPNLSKLPQTNFNCKNKVLGNYYADTETQCQMFHVCVQVLGVGVQDFRFLCPNGTAFDQEAQICTDWGDVDCHQASFGNGIAFDIFRLNVQKDIYSIRHNQTRFKEEEDPLKLQNLSQDNTDEIFRGSHSSNFFTNKNRGLEDYNIHKEDKENFYNTKSSNYNSAKPAKTEFKSVNREHQRNHAPQKPIPKEIRTPSESIRKTTGHIASDVIKRVSNTNNIGPQKNNTSLPNPQVNNYEAYSKQNIKVNTRNNNLDKIRTLTNQEIDFINSVNLEKTGRNYQPQTSTQYYQKETQDYRADLITTKKPNRFSSSSPTYLDYSNDPTTPKVRPSESTTFTFNQKQFQNSLSRNANGPTTNKNIDVSYDRSQYDKIQSNKRITTKQKAVTSGKLKPHIQLNYDSTTSTTSAAKKLSTQIIKSSVDDKLRKSNILLNNADKPTTFRPTTYKHLYNNNPTTILKKKNEIEITNSVRMDNKDFMTYTNVFYSRPIVPEADSNQEEEIFKASNSYNIGAYKVNNFPIQSTRVFHTTSSTLSTTTLAPSTSKVRSKLTNRGSQKSYDDILPEFIKQKSSNYEKIPENNYEPITQKQKPQQQNSVQQTQVKQFADFSGKNNNPKPFVINSTGAPKQPTSNTFFYETTHKTTTGFIRHDSQSENTTEKPKFFSTPVLSHTTEKVIGISTLSPSKKPKTASKKNNSNEDTSYDYAYYDDTKDYGALDVISDFEKIKKRKQ
ncbi:putative uncharacterized protein DDB_G0282133 [Condylostylus longicornis]|uniref:putative uncharacterized protein DDB_G0282133 n=1 Tax=Condylostylus longicornis TaxID=2530218 RepID=UPI00244E0A63|nr:putative uncharacterized protein DDB_G0282133 [Condylostylus longicornis]